MPVLCWCFFLFFISCVSHVTSAQTATYQLKDGTLGTGQIRYLPDGTRKVVVRTIERATLPADQIRWFETSPSRRFVPVSDFVVRLNRNKRLRITHDFAWIADTGRVDLLVYDLLLNPSQQGYFYLLKTRGNNTYLVVRDNSNKFDEGEFSAHDRKILLKVFGNDPNLQQLFAQHKLTCRNLPAYVRTFNDQFCPAR
ncbi:hypothetical protein [Hymenobacter latericus]|uniref:hypothetical protein n=1 Tax=Hymenobacter sp. YIM 151858-1 TaxID=2987688 RepID=UPI0022276BA0|nr:hypothetical protein [Hymenobacter sp. YIM 151858-1]UYZ59467.1 hypothetical protein OIS50_01405 [Hymenobacter sp. YIM 151858-1]